jgi:molecular chaperone HtpG
MATEKSTFKVGIDFQSILRAISKQIYETPLAFIRENVQNAVDAIRIQALRENLKPDDEKYSIIVETASNTVTVKDNGIGMSQSELQDYFWTIGASGKKTPEALKAGCVGMFGIGGFANFGICNCLEVVSKKAEENAGTLTRLSEDDIKNSGASIPSVTVDAASGQFRRTQKIPKGFC